MNRDHFITMGNQGTELTDFHTATEDISSMEGTRSPVQVWGLTAGLYFSMHLTGLSLSELELQSRKYFSAQAFTGLGFPSCVKPRGLSLGSLRAQCTVVSQEMHGESGYVPFSL